MIAISTQIVFPLLRRGYRRRIARGETIWLDDLSSPSPRQTLDGLPQVPADITPRPGKHRQARHMKAIYPAPKYPFAYRNPPVSGNVINGLGETKPRRAGFVFFGDGFRRAWGKLDWFYQVIEPSAVHRIFIRLFWRDRRRVGPVKRREPVPVDPAYGAVVVKEAAKKAGASIVGITHLTEEMRYRGFDMPFRHAIAVGIPMDRESMLHTPSERSVLEIISTYEKINAIAVELAEYIRDLGWPARAATNISPDASSEVLHLPVALAAGLGQLGKHGSMITREHGSNIRLAVVLTDMPLAVDQPVDFGVDDFCASCRICEQNCPPKALFPTKQMVRGVEKWYVNFDACVPYFVNADGCGICIEVCPWSEPGRGFVLAEKLRARRKTERKSA
ncbi:MAG: reductive dehalogenase domain-containing protein [Myxococcota bacterium]